MSSTKEAEVSQKVDKLDKEVIPVIKGLKGVKEAPIVIDVKGDQWMVFCTYVKVYFSALRLSSGLLELVVALGILHAHYSSQGLQEPFKSQIIFSTEGRDVLTKHLGISKQHLTNNMKKLIECGIVGKSQSSMGGEQYVLNPKIVPRDIQFKFTVNG